MALDQADELEPERILFSVGFLTDDPEHLFGVCEPCSGRLLAFARVLTDGVFKAFVFDVIVAKDSRGRGLGSRLMRRILEHPDLREVKHVEVACLPELETFYERLGFTTDVGGIRLMRRTRRA